jgi:hypothetical protein
MAANTLDRIDATHGGESRRWIAQLFVVGEASREQVRQKLEERYGVSVTTRQITTWRNGDERLIALMDELEAAKRETTDDDTLAKVPAPVNQTLVDQDFFSFANEFPAFAKLILRAVEAEEEGTPTPAALDYYGRRPAAADSPAEDTDHDPYWADMSTVMAAEHETPADFSADCERRLGGWEPPPPAPAPGAGALTP